MSIKCTIIGLVSLFNVPLGRISHLRHSIMVHLPLLWEAISAESLFIFLYIYYVNKEILKTFANKTRKHLRKK